MAEQSEKGGKKRDRRKESRVIYKGKHDEKTGRGGYSGCVRMCVHVFVKQERKQRQRDRDGEELQSYLVWHWVCEYESCCPWPPLLICRATVNSIAYGYFNMSHLFTKIHTLNQWKNTTICKSIPSRKWSHSLVLPICLSLSRAQRNLCMSTRLQINTVSVLLALPHSQTRKLWEKTRAHAHTPPRLIVAVMGRVSSNGTHKCPGEKSSLWIDRMWEWWGEGRLRGGRKTDDVREKREGRWRGKPFLLINYPQRRWGDYLCLH